MFDVITFGSVTVDAFAQTEYCRMIHDKNNLECIAYPVGTKILVDDLLVSVGGGGTNTAVSFSRLGLTTAFLGKMGMMDNSSRVIKEMKQDKVNTSLVIRSPKERTGYSIILDSVKHDRTILTYKGSNNNIKLSELPKKKLRTKCFYFTSLMNESFKTQVALSQWAHKKGIVTAYNISAYLARKGLPFLKKLLKQIDVLILNFEEAQLLCGKKKLPLLLKKLHAAGPGIVVITLGGKGAAAYDGKQLYSIGTHHVKPVETTGAGDSFGSAFVAGLLKKNDIAFALQLGTVNAESVIKHHGAKNKLLTWHEAMKVIKKKPLKVKVTKL